MKNIRKRGGERMIPLEKQVTSLELSKRLKELWVKQDSLFYITAKGNLFNEQHATKIEDYSAFTVAELGEILKREHLPRWNEDFDEWRGHYDTHTVMHHKGTEADARAKMLIWLIENKMMEVKKENV